MFNPLTITRIRLPHLSTMSSHRCIDKYNMDFDELRGAFLEKVVIIQVDDGEDDYIVRTIPGQPNGSITYTKPSDLVWTSVISKEITKGACVKDVVRWGVHK